MSAPPPTLSDSPDRELSDEERDFYRRMLAVLHEANVRFLVGGAYAFACYTGIVRHTKDFDIFVLPSDADAALGALGAAGCEIDIPFPHWIGKGLCGEHFIDVIYRSGNGVSEVDERWFEHAEQGEVFGVPVSLCPPEEIIWTKAFVMERERFDGADVAHILRGVGERIDWRRLLDRFRPHWQVLFAHLLLFRFIYPGEREKVPAWVLDELAARLRFEEGEPAPDTRDCRGTLLSRAQYLKDVDEWGYEDVRLRPDGRLTEEDVEKWTAGIALDGPDAEKDES